MAYHHHLYVTLLLEAWPQYGLTLILGTWPRSAHEYYDSLY